ncbi:MAG TPA: dihydrodipicolinate synthase family protein [Gemmatimonadaceae bacterium]|nr:dihydrodipicolinate synthase family protein [Gemmatimonadaceae bacterium]
MDLRGIFGPITTPFADGGELDRAALETNVRAHIEQGLSGIVVAGSTGEAPLLGEREREQLVQWVRPLVTGDRQVIVGVGAESTRATLKNAERAAEAGADAVLVVAPHYFGSAMTEAALRTHYHRIADSSPIPVILYNIPKYMHFRLSRGLVQELAKHENVIGIKDSSGDRDSLTEYLSSQSAEFTVMTGSGQLWGTALQMGARAGILAVSLFAASLSLAVYNAVLRKDNATADALQARLTPVAKVIVGDMGIAGVKAALDLVGLRGGAPRPPLLPLTSAERERVRQLLRDAELAVAA